eukprot:5820553-Amphidinium_carterae.2
METLEFLKAIALDWSSPDWTTYTSSKQGLAHWHREVLQLQFGSLDVLIQINVCTQRAATYKCLPDLRKVEQLLKGSESLEFSYNPHEREELLRI